MTDAQSEIQAARAMGKDAAASMIKATSHEAAARHWREYANADTLQAYGYWDGFLGEIVAA